MISQLRIMLLCLASLLCFVGYCTALIDWVQDYRTGVYHRAFGEAILETGALLIYTYAGVKFALNRMRFL